MPTAMAHVCATVDEVAAALDQFGPPYVVKDDGLAAGKGVVVTRDRDEALAHATACLARGGDAQVVVEEFLDGEEVSLFAITDGTTVVPLQPAQDFKRVADGDEGPNTGGMGAYSPLPWAAPTLVADVTERVLQPMVDAMHRRGTPFSGLLYAGLALTSRGIRVVEFNARFGDPETQVVLANLHTPLGGLLMAAATGHLAEFPPLVWESGFAVTVVIAADGYPADPRSGDPIAGLDAGGRAGRRRRLPRGHAGAGRRAGRDFRRPTCCRSPLTRRPLHDARERAYAAVDLITVDGSHHRRDIAERAAAAMPKPTREDDARGADIPNVLAGRYASTAMVRIWSPDAKIVYGATALAGRGPRADRPRARRAFIKRSTTTSG